MKLYTFPGNKNALKALIAGEFVGAQIEVPPFNFGVDNKTPEFLEKNPIGKIPVLETEKGCIFESNAIARYIARLEDVGLFGSNEHEMGLVEQWIDFMTNEVDAPLLSWVLPLLGTWPYDKKKEVAAKAAVTASFAVLNEYLKVHTYLVGEHITLADIVACCNMYLGFIKVLDPKFREDYPCVTRFFNTLINHPKFKKVLGDVEFCTETLKYTPPKKEDKKEQKAQKPKEGGAPVEAAEETKPAEKKEKPKTFIDLLPPTTMQMDSWKRLYSNTPAKNFREVCITRLWNGGPIPNSPSDEVFSGYDKDGYSFWFCKYKYPEENTVNFMVMNKVSGFLQRMDLGRKYCFGVMCILKDTDGKFPIHGVWMFRGQEIPPPVLEEVYDMELFDWTKADLDNEDDKKRLEDMIVEEDQIDDLELVECKVFK